MAKKDLFFKLFLKNNKKLFSFIVACVPNYADAEDLLQDVASVLWEKFDEYQMGTNFYAWAKQIARYKISNYYRQKKDVWRFDATALENIIEANNSLENSQDSRSAALQGCLNKLSERDLDLVKMRYQQDISVRAIARNSKLSVSALYKRLAFIYTLLRSCIAKTLIAWEADR